MIAVYCGKELDFVQREIKISFDFLFTALGYEHKFITSFDQLMLNDILIFYSYSEKPSIDEAYILAFNKIMFFIPSQPELFKPGFWNHDEIVKYKKTIKLTKPVSVLSKTDFESPVGYFCDKELVYGIFNFDLIGLLYFHLSQYDDYLFHGKDVHQRIPDDAYSFVDEMNYPYLNELMNLFHTFLENAVRDKSGSYTVRKELWPKGENIAVCLSHNVDKLQKWNASKIFKSCLEDVMVFYKVGYVFRNALNKLKYVLTNVEEYWNFSIIEEIEKRFQMKCSYFWGVDSHNAHDVDYDLTDNDHMEEIENILKNGNEIALLASYHSAKNDVIRKEIAVLREILNRQEIGVRQVKYRYDRERTPEFHRKQNIAYDASFRLLERNGFKNGLAIPFNFFQTIKENVTNEENVEEMNLEIPLHFCAETLIKSKFKQVSFEKAKDILEELIHHGELVNGLVTFDFSVANFAEIPYLKDLYRFLLKIIKTKKYYNPTLLELAQWWKKRSSVIVRETASHIYIHFPHEFDAFTISVLGQVEIQDVMGAKTVISDNRIFFESIPKDTTVRIKLQPTL
jgi:hypothetical protein